jgi:hypothetical protein
MKEYVFPEGGIKEVWRRKAISNLKSKKDS